MIGKDSITGIMQALDRQIGHLGGGSYRLVVCGGSALAALGLVSRTTRDVDILASAGDSPAGPVVEPLRELPESLTEAARLVARDFNLPEDWLNLGPARQAEAGLPEGFAARLVRRSYGSRLTVFYVGRLDQIHFKLFAAVDRNDYHTQDLEALQPSQAEIRQAALWTLSQDVSSAYRDSLITFLETIGHAAVAQELP